MNEIHIFFTMGMKVGIVGLPNVGKIRQEGKNYKVQEGDIIYFKFNI